MVSPYLERLPLGVRCIDGRLWKHVPQSDDPDFEQDIGACEGCAECDPAADDVLVTVCDACLRACCWQGEFMCDDARTASTFQRTVAELRAGNYGEHESYWNIDPRTGVRRKDSDGCELRIGDECRVKIGNRWRVAEVIEIGERTFVRLKNGTKIGPVSRAAIAQTEGR